MTTLTTDKTEALAKFLDCEATEIESWSQSNFSVGNSEYLVCTEDEAYSLASESIKESLWAFNATFLIDYMHGLEKLSNHESEQFLSVLKNMQSEMCEGCNLVVTLLIREKLPKLIQDAISADGIAHFLAQYDHQEHEEGEFFIYRTN